MATKFLLQFKFLLVFDLTLPVVAGYDCDTPNEWLGITKTNDRYAQFISNNNDYSLKKWPEAKVTYELNSTLSKQNIAEVYKAFTEYHSKTCVRFTQKQPMDKIFTSIEANNDYCGIGTVCMREGYQYARFGKHCTTKQTMIHELGHNLCLGHEHQRSDRDDYVRVQDSCSVSWTIKNTVNQPRRIYDYASQMHYDCGDCLKPTNPNIKGCGGQVTTGLSVLDADHINELYGCQGCFRHRWVPAHKFVKEMDKDLPNFGRNASGYFVYPCRSFKNSEIVIGTYSLHTRKCYVSFCGSEKTLENGDFEILTIPGGVKDSESEYMLVGGNENLSNYQLDALFANAVPASYSPWNQPHAYPVGFIGYGNLDYGKICGIGSSQNSLGSVDLVGKVWRFHAGLRSYFPVCNKEVYLSKVDILVCKPKLANRYPDNALTLDMFKNWKLLQMEVLQGVLSRSHITIVGQIFSDATDIYFLISKQIAAGPIPLLLHFQINSNSILTINSLDETDGWGREKQVELNYTLVFVPGNEYKLEIVWMQSKFLVIIKDHIVAEHEYKYDKDNSGSHFLRVYGDTRMAHVEIKDRDKIRTTKHPYVRKSTTILPEKTTATSEKVKEAEKFWQTYGWQTLIPVIPVVSGFILMMCKCKCKNVRYQQVVQAQI